jgi:hypothetical protein
MGRGKKGKGTEERKTAGKEEKKKERDVGNMLEI